MTACPLEHLVRVDIHRGDAGDEDEDNEEVEDDKGGEVLLVGAEELQLLQETSLHMVSLNRLLNVKHLECED